MKIKFIIFFFFISLTGFSQTDKTVNILETKYQNCLDKGEFMLGCTEIFYQEMDSLLNFYYNRLRYSCDSFQKENLKDEQLIWLEKRDNKFKLNKKITKQEAKKLGYEGGQIEQMTLIDMNANFVRNRVVELSKIKAENYSPQNYKVNPIGFYSLDSKKETKNGETYGYFGDILIRPILKNKVEVKLFICKGYPSYNSGTIIDTLTIINNKAIYKNTEIDSSCLITFLFFKRGIKVGEITNDYNSGCGFGHAVVADGFYRKKSDKIPTLKEMNEE